MKRLINRKCVAMALAILIALSSFSIIGATAVTTNDTTVGASTDVVDSNASIEQQQSNAKATYKILCKMDYGLRFVESEFPYSFTNQINGAKVTWLGDCLSEKQNIILNWKNKFFCATKINS